jgi:ABC-type antimicrobial peptide transport system permease subunit
MTTNTSPTKNEYVQEETELYSELGHRESHVVKEPKLLVQRQWREYFQWRTLKIIILDLLQRWKQYFIYTMRDTSKRKVSFCIGMASCFIVVWMVLLAMTVLDQVPLIFMRLAETQAGEFDLRIRANPYISGESLNYHTVTRALEDTNSTFQNSAPRIIFYDVAVTKLSSCNIDGDLPNITNSNMDHKWDWMYYGNSTSTCGKHATEIKRNHEFENEDFNEGKYCVSSLCSRAVVGSGVQFIAYDTLREQKMGFGRRWNLPALPPGEIYVTGGLAFTLGLKIGETVVVTLANTLDVFIGAYRQMGMISNTSNYDDDQRLRFNNALIHVPFVVRDIVVDYAGKIESRLSDGILADYSNLIQHIADYLPPQVFDKPYHRPIMKSVDMYQYAQYIYINHDTYVRISVYNKNDYGNVQAAVTNFATKVLFNIGYNQVNTEFPILNYMRETRFFALFLGLIISIIVTILTTLSIILIYSLLMISVESKQFEMGVLRMIGMTRSGLVQLILLQAFCYAFPAWIAGVLLGQVSYVGVSYILSRTLQLEEISRWITFSAFLIATAIGFIVPVISSILPIMTALGNVLTESLDTNRSRTKAVKYSIERASENDLSIVPVVLGLATTILGFCVYYFFPLSLLTFNITFLLYMFFGLILAMLFGLILLSLNVENVISMVLSILFFFWENVAIREIVVKNLIAHRERNRKTSIMFALSLGFIIFISVSVDLQLSTVRYDTIRRSGTRIHIRDSGNNLRDPALQAELEKFLNKHKDIIVSYSYMSVELRYNNGSSLPYISNFGAYKDGAQLVHAVSPNFLETCTNQFLKIKTLPDAPPSTSSPLNKYHYSEPLDTQLYTLRGTSKMIIGGTYEELLGINPLSRFLYTISYKTERFPRYTYKMLEPLAFLAASPVLSYSVFPQVLNQDAMVSFPTYVRLSNGTYATVRDVPIYRIFMRPRDGVSEDQIQYVKTELQQIIGPRGARVYDVNDELRPLNIASQVMDFFFIFTTTVAMAICFFSLVSSMYSNVNEQAKEIGILRAIGTRKFTIVRIFVYESIVLIMSASLTGMFIGAVVGYTMNLQNALFTQLPIDFVFPWMIVIVVFSLAILFGLFSSLFPVLNLLRLPIVTILRRLVT